jgi:hypothetical protein
MSGKREDGSEKLIVRGEKRNVKGQGEELVAGRMITREEVVMRKSLLLLMSPGRLGGVQKNLCVKKCF